MMLRLIGANCTQGTLTYTPPSHSLILRTWNFISCFYSTDENINNNIIYSLLSPQIIPDRSHYFFLELFILFPHRDQWEDECWTGDDANTTRHPLDTTLSSNYVLSESEYVTIKLTPINDLAFSFVILWHSPFPSSIRCTCNGHECISER